MSTLGKFICWLKRRHRWRKPRKGEAADSRYCARCGIGQAVRKRNTTR